MSTVADVGYNVEQAEKVFQREYGSVLVKTDKFFANLMMFQWIVGIIIALAVSPHVWQGTKYETHPHIWGALLLGGLIAAFPIVLVRMLPGTVLSRHTIAVAQMLTSALWIHLSGGRIETHFHVFGSLAFLAFYRDWKVLVTASAVTALDHIIRGYVWPHSIYGAALGSQWRWIEHAIWVVFEDVFLVLLCMTSQKELLRWAIERGKLEFHLEDVERQIMRRTLELQVSEASIRAVLNTVNDAIVTVDGTGEIISANQTTELFFGYHTDQFPGMKLTQLLPDVTWIPKTGETLKGTATTETRCCREDGTSFLAEVSVGEVELIGTHRIYTWVIRDITERKQIETAKEELHRDLVDVARETGMAEIATGVLHNVGNVLNSINVSATIVRESLQSSRVGRVGDVAAMLAEQGDRLSEFLTSDPKGTRIPTYLTKLNEQLAEERDKMLSELRSLGENIDHVKTIVAMQQSNAKATGMEEPASISQIIDDAIKFNRASITRHDIEIELEGSEVPETITDRQKILQILVNLIKNAKEAILASDSPGGKILITSELKDEASIVVRVKDTGMGIDPNHLDRIFRQGFTTKKTGHGFGLHSCAIAAQTLGGRMGVESEGVGCGATFTLELPFRPVEVLV